MVLGFLKSSTPPIAVDFGYSDLKIVQIGGGEAPSLLAAARAEVPENCRTDPVARFNFLNECLPGLLRKGGFKGRLVVSTIPAWQTFVQHMRVKKSTNNNEIVSQIRQQLQRYVAGDPESIVVRFVEVGEVFEQGQAMSEVICFAAGRDIVMRQVQAFKKCRLEIGGFHAEPVAILRAFDHIHRRQSDDRITTMYVDLGTACTKAMIAHGTELRFTKSVPFGGRFADQRLSEVMKCKLNEARRARLDEIAGGATAGTACSGSAHLQTTGQKSATAAAGGAPGSQGGSGSATLTAQAEDRRQGALPPELRTVDAQVGEQSCAASAPDRSHEQSAVREGLQSAVGQLVEELQTCIRYHQRLFENRPIDRLIFTGGESRDSEMCREIAESIGVVTFQGEPFKRLRRGQDVRVLNPFDGPGTFGWTVAVGLTGCPIGEI